MTIPILNLLKGIDGESRLCQNLYSSEEAKITDIDNIEKIGKGKCLGDIISERLHFETLLDLFPNTVSCDKIALIDPESDIRNNFNTSDETEEGNEYQIYDSSAISYGRLYKFIEQEFKTYFFDSLLQYRSIYGLPNFSSNRNELLTSDHKYNESLNQNIHPKEGNKFLKGFKVGVLLPNSIEMAVCLLSCLNYAVCIPLNVNNTTNETIIAISNLELDAIIVPDENGKQQLKNETYKALEFESKKYNFVILQLRQYHDHFNNRQQAGYNFEFFSSTMKQKNDDIYEKQEKAGLFFLYNKILHQNSVTNIEREKWTTTGNKIRYNEKDDIALLLHTSGTSGKQKIVPYTLGNLMTGVACIIHSWQLDSNDMNLSMMPLFHVGGLTRNILSPLFSGGTAIVCGSFDASLFWDLLQKYPVTWYYAAPTMHQQILSEYNRREERNTTCCWKLRMVTNAAGGLLESLALQLQDTFFNAVILPSYGMTECMPISSSPYIKHSKKLTEKESQELIEDRRKIKQINIESIPLGSSGKAVGPQIKIYDPSKRTSLQPGEVGNILVRGSPLMSGYLSISSNGNDENSGFVNLDVEDKNPCPSLWFDTGDMGFLDAKGFLYITGRSKEVINSGGEILSPFEIEQAILSHPNVAQVMAFSVPHSTLQETVGIAVVPKIIYKEGLNGNMEYPFHNFRSLRKFLKDKLHPTRWPQVIIYMDDLPRSTVNKVLRINFAERLKPPLPLLGTVKATTKTSDFNHLSNYIYKAICPSLGSSLDTKISISALLLSNPSQSDTLIGKSEREKIDRTQSEDDIEVNIIHHFKSVLEISEDDVINLDSDFFEMGGDSLKAGQLTSQLRNTFKVNISITSIFSERTPGNLANIVRSTTPREISISSIEESKELLDETEVLNYMNESNESIEKNAEDNYIKAVDSANTSEGKKKTPSRDNFFVLLVQLIPVLIFYPLIHSLKYFLFLEILRGIQELSVFEVLKTFEGSFYFPNGTKVILVLLAYIIAHIVYLILKPTLGICVKWLVIGRYKEGKYMLWGNMYLRWWLVHQVLEITGRGIFGLHSSLLVWYYRFLGAKIGSNVIISTSIDIGEFDLVTIGDNVAIDSAKIRPFHFCPKGRERSDLKKPRENLLCFKKISIGSNSTIGFKAVLDPGFDLPPDTHLSAYLSSRQFLSMPKDMIKQNTSQLHLNCRPASFLSRGVSLGSKIFYGLPAILLTEIFANCIWAYFAYYLYDQHFYEEGSERQSLVSALEWLINADRIIYVLSGSLLHRLFSPFLKLLSIIILKNLYIGKFESSSILKNENINDKIYIEKKQNRLQWNPWRLWLLKVLLRGQVLDSVARIVGSHYEVMSIIYRLLGCKIGKRVYWPGTVLDMYEFDLVTIGDDVTFGSRSGFICNSSIYNSCKITSKRDTLTIDNDLKIKVNQSNCFLKDHEEEIMFKEIIIKNGSMVADRCVIMSGTTVDNGAILGSGTFTGVQKYFAEQSISFGIDQFGTKPVQLFAGKSNTINTGEGAKFSKSEGKASRITPFGQAFYERKANYFVLPLSLHILFNLVTNFSAIFMWIIPRYLSIAVFYNLNEYLDEINSNIPFVRYADVASYICINDDETISSRLNAYGVLIILYGIIIGIFVVGCLSVVILSKWILMGKRTIGLYNWNISSYCQRWQLFLSLEVLRLRCLEGRGILDYFNGSGWLVFYFTALGSSIGKNVCLYPNGSNPMMTEPELVEIGDNACIDDCSLVAHINSRGQFSLNKVKVGAGSILSTSTRLLSGASTGINVTVLPRTLIMSGDTCEANTTWQGWPGNLHETCTSEVKDNIVTSTKEE